MITNTRGSSRSGVGGGMGSIFDMRSGAANAPIKRSVVQGPNRVDYPAPGARPVIAAPQRGDFSSPDMDKNLANQKSRMDVTFGDMRQHARGFNDPTHTSAFTTLMGLSDAQTSSAVDEARRASQVATSRAGYSGGFNGGAKQANLDKMKAVAEEGFKGAAQIRAEEGDMYGKAADSVGQQTSAYNQAMTAQNTAFGQALASRNTDQAQVDLGFAELVQKSDLSFADAQAKKNQLQAELDQQFNNSMIDNAKYSQMTRSLEVEWRLAQQKLEEQKREFDIGTGQTVLDRAEKARQANQNYQLGMAGVNAQQLPTQLAAGRRAPKTTHTPSAMEELYSQDEKRAKMTEVYKPHPPAGM